MPTPKSLTLYTALRDAILAGKIDPGQRLVLRRLAEEHGVSDIPVREALRMLERDGLIEMLPYRGARVVMLSPEEVEEAYLIRGQLESLATAEAVGHLDDTHFGQLEKCMSSMEEALEGNDVIAYAGLNREFHGIIFDACPYPRLAELIQSLWDGQAGFQSVFGRSPEWLRQSFDEHRRLLELLRAGDKEEARQLAWEHKQNVSHALVASLRQQSVSDEGAKT